MDKDLCAICLEEVDIPVVLINCKHSYCSPCMRNFLQQTKLARNCPQCRTPISDVDIFRWRSSGFQAGTNISHFRNEVNKNQYFNDESYFTGQEVHFQSIYSQQNPYVPPVEVKGRRATWSS
mmetsp:Transcript_124605/g.186137  ORF Transcript_124605/g.186137 Transcript_124605/m.186137 type:complete len:122 (-) Transcript_124605:52-417(-)